MTSGGHRSPHRSRGKGGDLTAAAAAATAVVSGGPQGSPILTGEGVGAPLGGSSFPTPYKPWRGEEKGGCHPSSASTTAGQGAVALWPTAGGPPRRSPRRRGGRAHPLHGTNKGEPVLPLLTMQSSGLFRRVKPLFGPGSGVVVVVVFEFVVEVVVEGMVDSNSENGGDDGANKAAKKKRNRAGSRTVTHVEISFAGGWKGDPLDERQDDTWRAEWRELDSHRSPKICETASARIPRPIEQLDEKRILRENVAGVGWLRRCWSEDVARSYWWARAVTLLGESTADTWHSGQ
ncbi:hypothetical protein Sjap_001562 [Stephania japonica]|uniref:Uncharacterized protein n=1 Tax=Stephania japonica TaxID=461633 RepID=A0AAP0KMH5_9MAGN